MRASPSRTRRTTAIALLTVGAVAVAVIPGAACAQEPGRSGSTPDADRDRILFDAAGCANCHTDSKRGGKPLAGGVAIETPFGTFHAPNITPDPEHGIGRWSDADFIRAMREGVAPDGRHYYPAFPYTSYTRMADEDMLAIKRHIFTAEPVAEPSPPHDLSFPFDQRWLLWGWKRLNFNPGPFSPDPDRPASWNRGAYLVTAIAHCGECHTPRDRLGGLDLTRWLGGNAGDVEGDKVPNITPDCDTGIGTWAAGDIAFLLETGMLPDGDIVGGAMYPIVEDGTDSLPAADREAIAEYLRSLPPVSNPDARAQQVE